MRNILVLALLVLVSMTWAVAQDNSASQAAGDQSTMPQSGQTAPPSGQTAPPSGQTAPPSGQMPPSGAPPSAGTGMPAAAGEITEGCLGGTEPNFTITDKAGKVYKLNLPQGANAQVLTQHLGESVQVMGTSASGGAATGSSAGGASSGGDTIQVSKIGKGTGTCPGSAAGEKAPPPK